MKRSSRQPKPTGYTVLIKSGVHIKDEGRGMTSAGYTPWRVTATSWRQAAMLARKCANRWDRHVEIMPMFGPIATIENSQASWAPF